MSTSIDVYCEGTQSITQEVVQGVCEWRNSLFCVSETIPFIYLARNDSILVYNAANATAVDTIVPVEVIPGPPAPPRQRRRYGAQPGPFDGEAINILQTFMLGSEEVLVSGDGLGRIIIRHVNDLHKAPLCFNVGSSVWGLDLKGHLLVASANSLHVYHINLQDASPASSLSEQLNEMRILSGPNANIPSVSISSDGKFVACLSIAGDLRIWTNEQVETGARSPSWSLLPDMGWGCCLLSQEAFRTVAHALPSSDHLEVQQNLVRSLQPKLMWWKAMGAKVMVELDPEAGTHPPFVPLPSTRFGISPAGQFELCWKQEKLELFTNFIELGSASERQQLVLLTTTDTIYLLHLLHPFRVQAVCHYPFGSKYVLNHDLERINMVRALPECGLVVVATQRGQVCVLELIKSVADTEEGLCYASFSFRCHAIPGAETNDEQCIEILGLDLKRVSSRAARCTVLYRAGHVRTFRIETKDVPLGLDLSESKL